ncbi:uncharacterized protein PGTG_05820 [Puccinia graminis f. sp. tritici CRL 75-36-700-3]|uniref:Uncharacterized protein n=1 Tax=Puccinia graminis f. sp. tritici (strain CRL 75-36-700-3 / race SCCL) TaxID=418459 RepID=E3K5S8_PUCGT|nr:uncharacterized protein PGTG_05820 [Puccinia graminis f. sp. tritici CRL 75-36-700-3]EFP79499.1 hypothetical protein PGTG_05820 [Puccinia graminis f. sp. tritici CRL 75-36-700-3]
MNLPEGQKRLADPSSDHGSIHPFGSSKAKPKPKKKQQRKHQPASNLANTAKTSSQTKKRKAAKSSNETVQVDSNGKPYDYDQDCQLATTGETTCHSKIK